MINFLKPEKDQRVVDEITEKIQEGTDIYLSWAFPKIVEKNFTCQICGKKRNIHVEYDALDLRTIVEDVNDRLNPSNRNDSMIKYKVQKEVVKEIFTLDTLDHMILCEKCGN
jgi:hypothetical protein